ncbi:PAS domain S-box protein [bacterium]|nr:PAS domain S-box protein [bacterium]
MTKEPTYQDLENRIKQLESALSRQQEELEDLCFHRKIRENLTQGVVLVRKTDNHIVYTDTSFDVMFGYAEGELKNNHVSILNAPSEKTPQQTSQQIAEILNDFGFWSGKIENVKKNGTRFWSRVNVSTFNHKYLGETWISTHEDITDFVNIEKELIRYQKDLQDLVKDKTKELQKTNLKLQEEIHKRDKIESELRESEQQMILALEGTEQGIWSWDVKGDIMIQDKSLLDILGYDFDKTDFNFQWWLDHLHPKSHKAFEQALHDYLEGKTRYLELEYQLKAKSGEWYWFWMRGVATEFDKFDCPIKMIGTRRHITEQKLAETQLRESNERYLALFERSRDAVYTHDFEGRFIDANKAALDMTGYSREDIKSISMAILLDKRFHENALEVIKEIIETGSQKKLIEYIIRNKQGDIIWVETKGSLIYKNGKPFAIQGIARDITERKLAEEQIKKTNSMLTSLIESPPDIIIYAVDLSYRYTGFNQAHFNEMGKTLGVRIETGMSILDVIPDGDDKTQMIKTFQEVFKGRRLTATEEFGSAENRVWYQSSYNPILDDKGEVMGATVFVSNITNRMRIQEELRKQEQTFRALAENSPDIIIRMDCSMKFVYVNPAFEWVTGVSHLDFIGKTSKELNLDATGFTILEKHINKVISSGESVTVEFYFKTAGIKIYYQVRIVPEVDKNNNVEYVLCAFRDITSLKHVEDELQYAHAQLEKRVAERTNQLTIANLNLKLEIANRKQTEDKLIFAKMQAEIANRAKSEFLANISHELRTPMHHILNYSKFGIDKIEKPREKLKHYFTQIRTTSIRLMFLLNELLDLSKLESGKMDYTMEKYDLRIIVNDSVNELSSLITEKGVILKLPDLSQKMIVTCDSYKIGQVIRNLLSNSIKFTPTGKKITVSLSTGMLYNNHQEILAAKVSVADEGIGIPEAETKLVFEKFVQGSKTKTGAGGTGLGLAISQKIITDHRGRIWTSQNPGGGAVFNFLIPVEQKRI